ncbi:putative major facilitator, sugar transporter, major facilitator superfamily [Septoria linicola]|nr:putative major facilitator, sugar transporter, major facilitator superfamily [Septoria linicola]
MGLQVWRHVPGKTLFFLLNLFSAMALIYEGYNQGVFGTVSGTPGFIRTMGIGADGVVTDPTKQGGLAASYYFGAIWGCLLGGWVADRMGRRKGVAMGAVLSLLGAALMAGSVNSDMMIIARIVAGLGIGFVNSIIPSWVSELATAHNRGSTFSLVFVANFLGIVIAYWLNFGIRHTEEEFRWRFPFAFMCIPMLLVLVSTPLLPESPRWLIANGRRTEAIDILTKLRGDISPEDPALVAEIEQLDAIVADFGHPRNKYINIFLGGRQSGNLHLGRRAMMGAALQTIQQWTGILAIATWATQLFSLAGFDEYKSGWLAGLINTFGIFGTAAASLVIDRLGRRKSLLISFVTQGVSLFLVAAFIKTSQDRMISDPEMATALGTAAAAFAFVFLWFFTMFNIVPCWIYGSEIWPQDVRAKGYSMTVLGWAIGCGVTGFIIPIMLDSLGYGTFLFFGAMNIVSAPIIWLFFPEVANKSLEEINLLFTSDSILVSKNMDCYHARLAAAGGSAALAVKTLLEEANGIDHGQADSEKGSSLHMKDEHVLATEKV